MIMIERIIDFSARNKFLVLLVTGFLIVMALWSVRNMSLDAIPDLSDTQVIVYSKWDRSPDVMEDQVTYPIITSLLGLPNVKDIRGFSDFGYSYVYVIFKDGTDLYWARSRVQEYLSKITADLPVGVKTQLGPDATGVGWVLQYALVDSKAKHSLADLRSFQDWNLRYHLQSVPGVAEVPSLGGYVKQYQVTVNPSKLQALNIPINAVVEAVRNAIKKAGGRLIEFSGAEYMVRGHGYLKGIKDLENIVIKNKANGVPLLLKEIAQINIGPDMRRGVLDLNGQGDVVGGTIVMRQGQNALKVIDAVKAKLKDLEAGLPEGVHVEITYDRSVLIKSSIENLQRQLIEEMIVVSLVIIIFLWHLSSAVIPIITIPISILLSFIFMQAMHLTTNIMSLAGIAISIGVLVDGAIVQMENVYKRLEEWQSEGKKGPAAPVILNALKEVAPSVFFSLLVIAVSFLPIFTLLDQEGRLFKPLAWSKTFAMAIAAVLVITLNPALRMMFTSGKGNYYPEHKHPISSVLFKIYEPVCRFVLRHAKATIAASVLMVLLTIPVFLKLGSEFMPSLWEGQILYMPTTMPGISIQEAQALLQKQDAIIKSFPEVDKVFGKAGRMETATDPAPLSMMETVILLKSEKEWPKVNGKRRTHEQLIESLDQALKIPGTSNAWTMPIKNRIDMLSTGIRTPIGIKVQGKDLETIEKIGLRIESLLKGMPDTRSVFAERVTGGYFLDIDIKRDRIARYGLSVKDVQMAINASIGGELVTTTIEGRERYGVNVRYPKELRDNIPQLSRVMVANDAGQQFPLGSLADIVTKSGPAMIRDENGMLTGYVFVDIKSSDIGGYVKMAKAHVNKELKIPTGYSLVWSGQYENMLRVQERLKVVLPLTLLIIVLLLYFNTKSWIKTGIVLLAVPFSLIGAVWFLWLLDYNLSIAVWVGMIALMGLDAETGVLMLLFLDMAYKDAAKKNKLNTDDELKEAVVQGAVKRVRPKLMTVMAAMLGLMPIMWSHGSGSDVMSRIAAPMIGGLATSFLLELLVYPSIFYLWKAKGLSTKL
jgi:Cu(I)/Ag(I) efflux system membrane protein CusA/SilA